MFVSRTFTFFSFIAVLAAQGYADHPSGIDDTYNHIVGQEFGTSQWAEAVTTVQKGSNVIVKLDCLGCPFRLRTEGEERWEETPRDNALMLNYSLSHSGNALFLNDRQILPLRDPPPFIDAYQTPANLTVDELSLMIDIHQLNYRFGKAEGSLASYGLSYDHSIRPAASPNGVILDFDIIGWSQAAVDDPAQQMVSIEVGSNSTGMIIREVSLVPRPPPYRGEPTYEYPFWCPEFLEPTVDYLLSRSNHPDPPGHTVLRRHEWDGFGRKGTLRHDWEALCGWFGWTVVLVIVAVVVSCLALCYGLYRLVLHIRRSGDQEHGAEEREQLMGYDEDADETFDEKVMDEEALLASLTAGKYRVSSGLTCVFLRIF